MSNKWLLKTNPKVKEWVKEWEKEWEKEEEKLEEMEKIFKTQKNEKIEKLEEKIMKIIGKIIQEGVDIPYGSFNQEIDKDLQIHNNMLKANSDESKTENVRKYLC